MISAQLWSLRDALEADGWGPVVDRLTEAGFAAVEPFDIVRASAELTAALARTGLTAPTAHGDLTGDALAATLDAAAALGARTVLHPSFQGEIWHTPDGIAEIAEHLSRAADAAAAYGMSVGFHNHDDDLHPTADGTPALVALMGRVGPGIGVELDPYWATVGGADVPAVVAALGERILAVHLKDGPRGGGNADQVAVGDGDLDWPALLRAIDPAVPRVIALDMIATDPFAGLLRSRAWLERAGLVDGVPVAPHD